ncbi:MAG: hypothetical protein IKU37_03285 [Candidatus Gastranaerophilales bacterium]|nr:hypothetical protein [Candidatus Gastranaerophilales bacterium]
MAGKELYKKVNIREFLITADKEYNHSAWVGEIGATHPYLSRRLYNIAKRTKQEYIVSLPKDMFKVSKISCVISCFFEMIVSILLIAFFLGLGATHLKANNTMNKHFDNTNCPYVYNEQ